MQGWIRRTDGTIRTGIVAAVLLAVAAGCSSADNNAAPTSASSTSTTTTVPETTTTSTTTTSTTLPPTTTTTLPVEGALVKVANASEVDRAAFFLTQEFAFLGFATADPTNAAGIDESLEFSKVYFRPGAEAAALSIAGMMGGIEVLPMPTPAWIQGGTAALGDANVLVMLGRDLAGTALPDMGG